ncbi:hypothetical protein [Blastopirellula retiformator]|uniref:Uncharacterized protein n=1 Tax=Blastopirellula retiformator TaxID=2527970 RepID=A0A5C5V672_9BACT|nr:hypothetical protein [Blastopirellula retiformator]TWT33399.1 hypothetical protein Enr8_32290 [Blastopirellula retiformator]
MSNDDRFTVNDPYAQPPRKKSSGAGWIFGIGGCIVAAVFAPFLLVCGCCGGLMQWAMNQRAEMIATAVEGDETLRQEIGDVSSCSINWSGSMSAGDDVFVFDVSGDKGSGSLYVHEAGDDVEKIVLHKGDEEWELTFDPEMLKDDWTTDPEVTELIDNNPSIRQEIGEIEKCEMNLGDSISEDDPNLYIYDIVGDKGRGQLEVMFDDDDEIVGVTLKKEGKDFELNLGDEPSLPPMK